jgi:hypothetical protein
MPQPLPKTLLSMIYHATIDQYRDEAHTTPDVSFQRFGITDATSKARCREVDVQAGELRKDPQNDLVRRRFNAASVTLFDQLRLDLDAERSSTQPDQPPAGSNHRNDARLLTAYYLLRYSSAFRNSPEAVLRANLDPQPVNQAALQAAWDAAKAALKANLVVPPAANRAICDHIALEFKNDVWQFVW